MNTNFRCGYKLLLGQCYKNAKSNELIYIYNPNIIWSWLLRINAWMRSSYYIYSKLNHDDLFCPKLLRYWKIVQINLWESYFASKYIFVYAITTHLKLQGPVCKIKKNIFTNSGREKLVYFLIFREIFYFYPNSLYFVSCPNTSRLSQM